MPKKPTAKSKADKTLRSSKHPRFFKKLSAATYFKFLFVYLLFLAICFHRLDPDFGWHLSSGNYYRQQGIPSHDIFTYTAQSFPWINHEWGNDIILSLLYSVGGYGLAAFFYAALWTLAVSLRSLSSRFIFVAAAVAAMLPFAGIRPEAWSLLFFAMLLNLFQAKKRPSWPLVGGIFIIWANLHGGVVLGLGLIFYFLLKYRERYWAKLLAISVLVTFINPYGPRLYQELARTLFDRSLHNQIAEWNNFVIFVPSLAFICLWWAGFWLYRRQRLSNWLGLGPMFFAATLSASRYMPLFVITALPELEKYYIQLRSEAPKKLNRVGKIFLGAAALALAVFIVRSTYPLFWPWGDRENSDYPVKAVVYLIAHPCPGRLFNDYNYGGYLIWKLPAEPVYIDGRMPSWRDEKGQKYMDRYFAISKESSARKKEFAHYGIKCVLIRSSNAELINGLEKEGWKLRLVAGRASLVEAP